MISVFSKLPAEVVILLKKRASCCGRVTVVDLFVIFSAGICAKQPSILKEGYVSATVRR